MTVSFASILDELEVQIRANRAPKLQHLINTINPQNLPRSQVARYANLLRRMGEMKYAFGLLNPIIHSQVSKPTIPEIVEYASCLTRLGLEDESLARLMKIKDESHPEIPYEIAMAHVSKWDYPSAILYFEKYLRNSGLSTYKIYVGKVNLAASLIFTNKLNEADAILQEILPEIKKGGFDLLWGNVLELLSHIAIVSRDFKKARKFFEESQKKLVSSNPRYQLYLEKWVTIGKMLQENGSKKSLIDWERLRKKTVGLRDWNTLREIELFKAVATDDVESIKKLYYGIPYPEYRKRILYMWERPLELEEYQDRQIGQSVSHQQRVFDVASGKDLHTGSKLKPGQALHRLLQVLASDFYSPFLTTRIFSNVYEGASFNPTTSPGQVYETVKRLNRWFLKNKIPLFVHSSKFGYRLRATEAYTLRIQGIVSMRAKADDFINNLMKQDLTENFSLQMVVEKLGLPKRTASRLLSESVNSGKLVRSGKSQGTLYNFALKKAV